MEVLLGFSRVILMFFSTLLSFAGLLWRLNRPSGLEKKAQTEPKGPSGSVEYSWWISNGLGS